MSSFTKFLDNLKTQKNPTFTDSAISTMPSATVDDFAIPAPVDLPPKRRWSYTSYLNLGTLHGDGDNLMLGL